MKDPRLRSRAHPHRIGNQLEEKSADAAAAVVVLDAVVVQAVAAVVVVVVAAVGGADVLCAVAFSGVGAVPLLPLRFLHHRLPHAQRCSFDFWSIARSLSFAAYHSHGC